MLLRDIKELKFKLQDIRKRLNKDYKRPPRSYKVNKLEKIQPKER